MRKYQGNTLDTELELYDATFTSLSMPNDVPISVGLNLQGRYGGVLTIHSKDAQGSGEHAGPRIGALPSRVHELRLSLAVPVSGGHNSWGIYAGVLTIHSKDA